jgi:hypothetical protein
MQETSSVADNWLKSRLKSEGITAGWLKLPIGIDSRDGRAGQSLVKAQLGHCKVRINQECLC